MNMTGNQVINIVTVNSRSAVIRELGQIRICADVIEDVLRDKDLISLTVQQRTYQYRHLIKALFRIKVMCERINQDVGTLNEIMQKAFPDVVLEEGIMIENESDPGPSKARDPMDILREEQETKDDMPEQHAGAGV